MAIAIITDTRYVLFGAVTRFRESNSTSVTKNPVQEGYNISDGAVRNNAQFSFSGIVSSVDFRDSGADLSINKFVDAVQISYNKKSNLQKMLPSSVQNLLATSQPSITLSDFTFTDIRDIEFAKQSLRDIMESAEKATILLSDSKGILSQFKEDCVITSVDFDESNSDDALYADISFEEIITAVVEKATIDGQKFTTDQISNGMATTSNKGVVGEPDDPKKTSAKEIINDSYASCMEAEQRDGRIEGASFANATLRCMAASLAEYTNGQEIQY